MKTTPEGASVLNESAVKHSIKFLKDLKSHVEKPGNWPFDIKGSSILIGVDNRTNKPNNCAIRLIDFNSVESMDQGYLDEGLVKGLQTLI